MLASDLTLCFIQDLMETEGAEKIDIKWKSFWAK